MPTAMARGMSLLGACADSETRQGPAHTGQRERASLWERLNKSKKDTIDAVAFTDPWAVGSEALKAPFRAPSDRLLSVDRTIVGRKSREG